MLATLDDTSRGDGWHVLIAFVDGPWTKAV